MSYNGSGTFNINTAGQPVVAGTVISSTAFNALTADLGTGLSTALTKDGQTVATARIPFAQGINSSLVTDATSTTTGSIITAGGVGIAKALYVGTTLNVTGASTLAGITGTFNGTVGATTPSTGAFTTLSATGLITSTLTSGEAFKIGSSTAGTGILYMSMFNTSGGLYLGLEGSAGGTLWTGIPAYATGLGARTTGGGISFSANSTAQHMLLTTSGLAVTGTLSATTTGKVGTTLGVGAATPSASGAGITFPATQSASTDANTLDDYEEGTWTPTQGAGLTVVGAFSSSGRYTKIGRSVSISGRIAGATSIATTAGTVMMGAIPFSIAELTAVGTMANGSLNVLGGVGAFGTTAYSLTTIGATSVIDFSLTYSV